MVDLKNKNNDQDIATLDQAKVNFTLNGRKIESDSDKSLWTIAKEIGLNIPHLCHKDSVDYRPDGNCRACMVEIDGERTLAASCIRKPTEGMVVNTATPRAKKAREMLFKALMVDQPPPEKAHDQDSEFWNWTRKMGLKVNDNGDESVKLPKNTHHSQPIAPDQSHPAIAVNLDACIQCGLCVRACREVQANDVIGMAGRGADTKIIFDFDDPMGASTCVACGECVQACPTGALMEANLLDEHQVIAHKADKIVDSVCPYCGVGCQTSVHVKDDKIIKIDGREGPANENRLCVKGRFGYDYIHHPERLTKPLIRKANAPKIWDQPINHDNYLDVFEETTWENALTLAAAGLTRIKTEQGGNALAGFGSAKGSNEEAYLFQKLFRQGLTTNNVDHCTRLCHASSVAALMESINSGAVSAPFGAVKDSELIIVIGARPAENHPVAATYMKNAAKAGATLIVMDPRGQNQGLSRYADHVVQFKAGSDVALLNAMIHTIITEDLVDHAYIEQRTEDYDLLVESIQNFTPEAMQEICGIDAERIKMLARLYAKSNASIIFWGMGISQHVHGTDNARALIALSLITGQIGRPGTGLHPLRGQNNVQGASDAGLIPMVYPDYQRVDDESNQIMFEAAWERDDLDNQPGLTVVEIIDAIHDDKIKGMYIMGENPAMSDPDQQHAREALAKLDHLVVQDIFLTETAAFADIIFPASAHAEKLGTYTNTNREIQIGRPAVALPGEAKQDWWLIQEMAKRIGLNWTYAGPSEICDEMSALMFSRNYITWKRIESEDCVTYPCTAADMEGLAIVFANGFPTLTGRAKIVPARYSPPDELPDEDYPFILTTGRLLEHWHTGAMTRRSNALDSLEPDPIACLNRHDMRKMQLEAGTLIEVKTRRGKIKLKARMDNDIPEGMVFIPFCFHEAAANLLTNPKLDPYGKIPEFKYCAAQI
ncbi:MAG: formate dehydrogenase subunit alpha, partial [Alphaproteobacteria bacterium]